MYYIKCKNLKLCYNNVHKGNVKPQNLKIMGASEKIKRGKDYLKLHIYLIFFNFTKSLRSWDRLLGSTNKQNSGA